MTTTAWDQFTTASQFGSGDVWQLLSNLEDGSSAQSFTKTNGGTQTNTVRMTVAAALSGVDDAAIFNSMRLRFDWEYDPGSGTDAAEIVWDCTIGNNGYTTNIGPSSGSGTVTSLDGDRSYWGITSVTDSALIGFLKDGTVGFDFVGRGLTGSNKPIVYLSNIELQVTYTLPEGREGAVIAAMF